MQERTRAESISKRYAAATALDNVSVTAHRGECLGIFGPSSAGKSVLLRLLAGIELPDSGTISTADPHVGFSRQFPSIPEDLTPAEALSLFATLYRIPRGKRRAAVREILTLVGLDSVRNRRIGTLPGGMQKLLEVTRALMSPSDLLLLDEPMAGIDSYARRRLWEHLLRIRTLEQKTIVLAMSRPEDAELCDRIVLLHQGRILATGTLAQLRSMAGPEALVIKPKGPRTARAGWSGIVGKEEDGSLVVEFGLDACPVELLKQITGDIAAVRIGQRSLDFILEELVRSKLAEEQNAR